MRACNRKIIVSHLKQITSKANIDPCLSKPRFDDVPQYDTVHAETQVSKFESLMTLYVMFKMITSFCLQGKTRKKKRNKND